MTTLALLIALSVSAVAATFALPTPAAGDPVKIAVVVMENKGLQEDREPTPRPRTSTR